MFVFERHVTELFRKRNGHLLDGRLHVVTWVGGDRHSISYLHGKDKFTEISLWVGDWKGFEMSQRTRYGVEFVNLRVPREKRDEVTTWSIDHETELGDMVDQLVANGYKISLNQDTGNDCFLVAITGSSNSPFNRGLCMTSRAGSIMECLYLALYKHFVLCEGKDWPDPEARDLTFG